MSYIKSQNLGSKSETIFALSIASAMGIFATISWARLTDFIGRRPQYIVVTLFNMLWAAPMFLLVNTANIALIIATFTISYCVSQNALAGSQGTWFPELFNANIRSSGAALAYQISAMISGITPFVTTILFIHYGWHGPAALFFFYSVFGFAAALLTRETWTKAVREHVRRAVAKGSEVAGKSAAGPS